MARRTSIALGLLLLSAVLGVVVLQRPSRTAALLASASASAAAAPSASAGPANDAGSDEDDAGSAFEPGDAGAQSLPAGAPKQVGFGVVLFVYDGAQSAPKGSRTKAAALELARSVVAEAKQDFAAAVKKGDRGSVVDAGKIPRGILEPPIEFVLFTLPKGQVADEPIDTLRGYWVVRRSD